MAKPELTVALRPGALYLGGTMTAFGLLHTEPGALLTGIRFRPGGLYAFYRLSMESAVDGLLEFGDPALAPLMAPGRGWAARLDAYLATRLKAPRYDFTAIYRAITEARGQVSVEELARICHVSKRTLERIFRLNVGIPPKQYIRIARFQQVLARLRQPFSEESLLRMAYDLGYYDHAHLTNEFKQYAGILPSELSRFSKTGIAHGQYF
jgi:AraC-like DNA-binding protein